MFVKSIKSAVIAEESIFLPITRSCNYVCENWLKKVELSDGPAGVRAPQSNNPKLRTK